LKIKDLLSEKRVLETEIAERQEALHAIEVLIGRIRRQEGHPPEAVPSLDTSQNNGIHRRTRGTLKAAKQAVFHLPGTFTRSQLITKIEELNPALAGKIKAEAQRSTLRTLATERLIELLEDVSEETGEVLYRKIG
jgi:hypothetical protein